MRHEGNPGGRRLRWTRLPRPAVLLALATTAQAQPCPEGARALREVQLQGVHLLPADRTRERLLSRLGWSAGRCIDAGDVLTATDALRRLYADGGYGAIRVDVLDAPADDGVLRLGVVEGRLAAAPEVVNAVRHTPQNLRASLPALAPGAPLRLHALDAQLRLANDNPSKELQVLLKPVPDGDDGAIAAELRLREMPVRDLQLALDNTGSRETGRHRVSALWRHADLTGRDDVLSLQAQTSPDAPSRVRVLSAGYRLPRYGPALALEVFAAGSSVRGTHRTAAGDLTLNGDGDVAGAKATWFLPRWDGYDQRLAFALERRRYRNQCAFSDLPPEACGAAGADATLVPATLEYTAQRTARAATAFGVRLQRGLGGGSSTEALHASRLGARADAWPVRYGATVRLPFGDDWLATLRGSGQWSRQPLIPGEMFGAGGPNTVRGYPDREVAGDIGWTATLEVGRVGLFTAETQGRAALSVVGFVDAGNVRNRGDLECRAGHTRCRLASVGGGLRALWDDWSLHLDLGIAQRETPDTRRGRVRAHFALATHFGH